MKPADCSFNREEILGMKEKIEVFDYANEILKALKKGCLLTTKADGKVNTMTIGWGLLGIEFDKPTFLTLVRKSRYTFEMLEKNPEFTVNIPMGDYDKKIIGYCGSKSGRDVDKISACGLHLEDPDKISVPGIREFPLTLECRVCYAQQQEGNLIPGLIREKYFPTLLGQGGNFHKQYYGEIVSAYIIK
jgi:flavin reductase (DIM6/NTAB) family NADH-FMN oxidoreductase RutF